MRSRLLAALCVLAAPFVAAAADPKPAAKGKTDPPGVPLAAVLTSKKASYPLDLGGKTADEYRRLLDAAASGGEYPPPPAVDLSLELRNTGDKDVRIRIDGTTTIIDLDLQGPGAVTIPLKNRAASKPTVAPLTVTLERGKSQTIPITALAFGFKDTHAAYWLAPGKYTLTAAYQTTVSPAPAGAEAADEGFGAVTVASAPLTLTVEGK